MKIACTSDTHGVLNQATLPPADVLVIAGDYCPDFGRDRGWEYVAKKQVEWLGDKFMPFLKRHVDYKEVIIIAGNHDWCHFLPDTKVQARNIVEQTAIYLEDESCVIDGIKFHGSPWQPWFYEWAFNFPEFDAVSGHPVAVRTWAKIPKDTKVLITHGPPFRILDNAPGNRDVGCPILRDRVVRIKPKLHIFGHIHSSYGAKMSHEIQFANVALCANDYVPHNPIQVFEV